MKLKGINQTVYTLAHTPISSGGEGDIYVVRGEDINKVAKIYKPDVMTGELEEKLKVMVNNPPNAPCLPR